MVRYDSKTSTLVFHHVLGRDGSEPFKSIDMEVDLSSLPENIRQLLILTAKLSSSHAASQKLIALRGDTTKDGKTIVFIGDRYKKLVESFKKPIETETVEVEVVALNLTQS